MITSELENKNGIRSKRTDKRERDALIAQASDLVEARAVFDREDNRLIARATVTLLMPSDPTPDQAAALDQLPHGDVERRFIPVLRQLENAATLSRSEARIVEHTRHQTCFSENRPPEPPDDPDLLRELGETQAAVDAARLVKNRVIDGQIAALRRKYKYEPSVIMIENTTELLEATQLFERAERRHADVKRRIEARRKAFQAMCSR